MQIRIIGTTDLVIRLNDILQSQNIGATLYKAKNPQDKRLYINIDDRKFSDLLYSVEDGISDLKTFKLSRGL